MRRWLAAVALVAATVVSAAATVWAQSTTGPPAVEIHKGWMEIESFEDYRRAWRELRH